MPPALPPGCTTAATVYVGALPLSSETVKVTVAVLDGVRPYTAALAGARCKTASSEKPAEKAKSSTGPGAAAVGAAAVPTARAHNVLSLTMVERRSTDTTTIRACSCKK